MQVFFEVQNNVLKPFVFFICCQTNSNESKSSYNTTFNPAILKLELTKVNKGKQVINSKKYKYLTKADDQKSCKTQKEYKNLKVSKN